MVRRALRSRTLRKVFRKVPGGRTVIHYKPTKPKLGTCPLTGEKLRGVARTHRSKARTVSKSAKRPNRPYGGHLSTTATRVLFKKKAREEFEEQVS